MWALGRAAPTPLVPSAQREAATGLPYRRPGPRRCTPSRRRARSARRRWQPAAAPPGTQARSALGAQRRAPSAERVARGGDQARRRRRARSAHATGAERVARGGASWHAGAARASSRSSNAGRLLPASATLTSFVGGIKTMSPALGRRPPISTQVIASVEKYENAGMKFSTVPAFTLAESRASDACCLFLVQKTHTREVSLFSSPGKFRPSCAFWINCTRGERTASTHELRRAVPVRNLPAAAHAALL